tara:strand:- start:8359 stop:9516 length:1158 start_codon:yes stop_codon:yes gene_type:complete
MKKISILVISGEDLYLRIPSLIALKNKGYSIFAAGSVEHPWFAEAGIKFYKYDLNRKFNLFSDIYSMRRIKEIYYECKPDIVHAFDTKPCILTPLSLGLIKGANIIRTINGMGVIFSENNFQNFFLRIIYIALHFFIRSRVSLTIFQNSGDMNFFRKFFLANKNNSQIIAGSGISVNDINQKINKGSRKDLRDYLFPQKDIIFILVSRMIISKGIETFIEAANIVIKKNDKVGFLLVGPDASEEPEGVKMDDYINLSKEIKYLGKRDDIPNLLNASDFFVLPTFYKEGIPRALLEAQAIGLPAIVSNISGCKDVIIEGKNGWQVPPNDKRKLANKIIQAIETTESKKKEMSIFSKRNIIEKYSVSVISNETDKVYKKSINEQELK